MVFANVFLQQLGLPIPAVPTLLVVGSLVAGISETGLIIVAMVLASVLADWIWYLSGRAFGYRVLSGLCKLSINPASCVTQTEDRFLRWGLWSLVVAKFIPGFSTVAPPIAGALRMSLSGFLTAAAAGALLWGGVGNHRRLVVPHPTPNPPGGARPAWRPCRAAHPRGARPLVGLETLAEIPLSDALGHPPYHAGGTRPGHGIRKSAPDPRLAGRRGTGCYRCRSRRRAGRTRQSSGGGRLPAEIG